MTKRTAIGLALAAVLVAASASPSTVRAAAPPGTSCSVFPADNVWNTDISALPVHSRSAAWLASTGAASGKLLHPDFGGPPYGIPFNVVSNSHATANFNFLYWQESDPTVPSKQPQGPYPYGSDLLVEGPTDSHLVTINKDTCKLYETSGTDYNGAHTGWSGAIFDLASNALRADSWTSADAAGLPIFPGLVRVDEVQAGAINHAIRFTVQRSDTSHLWPARHDAGAASDPNLPPMGARFRLKSSFDVSGFNAQSQVVLTAMKHYGLIVADNGSNWYFQGTMDSTWNNEPYATMVTQLKTVPASAFEAVDESSLMVDSNSAKAIPPSPCATVVTVANPATPQSLGTPVQISGTARGCPNPVYEFWLLPPGGTWVVVQPYSTNATFNWSTTNDVAGSYRFSVWARDAGSTGTNGSPPNTYDAFSAFDYGLTTTSCTGMSASASPSLTATAGNPVTVTGSATGCPSPRYQFWLLPAGGTWTLAEPYSTNATFNWSTTGNVAGSYRFSVWARDAGSTGTNGSPPNTYDAFSAFDYGLTTTSCTGMSASASPSLTATAGNPVTVIGSATGCPSPRYQFWLLPPGGTWTLVQPYSTNATFNWSTNGKVAGSYRFSVWARDAGSSAGYDAFSAFQYALTTPSCSGMSASASPPSGEPVGTQITVTATATGCPNPSYEVWELAPGGTWTLELPYASGSPTLTAFFGTVGRPSGTYRFSVWARDLNSAGSNGSPPYTYDSFSAIQYILTPPTPCSAVNVSVTPPSQASSGTAVSMTASATGCVALYQFWVLPPGGTWSVVQPYSGNATLRWDTTGKSAGSYRISVWARDASRSSAYDAFSAFQYSLT